MSTHKTPELSDKLLKRIQIVRRDMGNLLFHFTRAPKEKSVNVKLGNGDSISMQGNALSILKKILYEGKVRGTSVWTNGSPTVCLTEAPIQEFNSIFSLVEIASSQEERPRYEPYGIAVSKTWLFEHGGRPVIYDHPEALNSLSEEQQYRFVPYDPANSIDFTWEREWRIKTDALELDPQHTLVVVPTSEEAFDLVYEFSKIEADFDIDGSTMGSYHVPQWLAVSLDMFGFEYVSY